MADDRPMMRLDLTGDDWVSAMQRGDNLPLDVTVYTAQHVINLKCQGLTFAQIAPRAPETLSPSGAWVVLRQYLKNASGVRTPRRTT